MPTAPKHPCTKPGCGVLLAYGAGSRCAAHKPPAFQNATRTADRNRASGDPSLYKNQRWQTASFTHLRDYPYCAQCGGAATTVDHIIPHDGTPTTFWVPTNWQSLCARCHNAKSGAWAVAKREAARHARSQTGAAIAMLTTPTTLVAGPPGSGKSAYVAGRVKWGDLVVDLDALYQAVTGGLALYDKPAPLLPFVLDARDALIARLSNPRSSPMAGMGVPLHAWVIMGAPKREDRQHWKAQGATVVVLDVPAEECLRRIASDPRRDGKTPWADLVAQWWREYQP